MIANKVIWVLVTSIDAECSVSQYEYLLNRQHESLTPSNFQCCITMEILKRDLKIANFLIWEISNF